MEKTVLIDRIKDEIGDKKVLAAVFYTFNFQPTFFENYVMPILIKDGAATFSDEKVRNTILWRYLDRENKIPPITVYCDYYAKDNSEAPTLGYQVECVRIPSVKGKITNFHPKNSFILLDNGKTQELLLITGSGNLTPSGWCDNIECFSTKVFEKKFVYPSTTKTENLQDFIKSCARFSEAKILSEAENKIYNFLKYQDDTLEFFNSIEMSFKEYLDSHINWDEIIEVEVVSPYFSKDLDCISYLEEKKVESIKCLLPTFKSDEVMLDEELFNNIRKTTAKWCTWKDRGLVKPRNPHAKIYRFYTLKDTITIIGSVNFTTPAWSHCNIELASANVETAMLYKEKNNEKNQKRILKEIKDLDSRVLRFAPKESLEDNESIEGINRMAPDISFTIDWTSATLEYEASIESNSCSFYNVLENRFLLAGKESIALDYEHLHIFSKKALLQIQTEKGERYTYYANQKNVESKPLGFKLDANVILKYWTFLENPFQQDKITRELALALTDASGIVDISKYKQPLLNEMAAHFAGLTRLENHLFETDINTQKAAEKHFEYIEYYLLKSNVDTLLSYFDNLGDRLKEGTIQNSFYYMIGKILIHSFYEKALKNDYPHITKKANLNNFKKSLKIQKEKIELAINDIVDQIEGLRGKETWVTEQLI